MNAGPRNSIADVGGLTVGAASDDRLKSGVSVVVGDGPMVAGVSVMGGAPGTRETDLLRPDATVEAVDALVLAGGSAFGLAACDGVVSGLRACGRGFEAAGHRVPIVPGAILFDLANGGEKGWKENPYVDLGRAAFDSRSLDVRIGTAGAGTGATVSGLKGGLGAASAVLPPGGVLGALVAVNAIGQVTVGDGPHFWAAPFEVDAEFGGLGISQASAGTVRTKLDSGGNTTIAVVATDVRLSKSEATRMAIAAQDGIARAIVPAHTPMDGDLVFACSTGLRDAQADDALLLGHVASVCLARAIARGVFEASSADGDVLPTWASRHSSSW